MQMAQPTRQQPSDSARRSVAIPDCGRAWSRWRTDRLCPLASGSIAAAFFFSNQFGPTTWASLNAWGIPRERQQPSRLGDRIDGQSFEALRSLHHRPPLWFGARGEADCFFYCYIPDRIWPEKDRSRLLFLFLSLRSIEPWTASCTA
jgi:hypothetical protein